MEVHNPKLQIAVERFLMLHLHGAYISTCDVQYLHHSNLMSHEVSHKDKNDWIMDGHNMTQLNGTSTLRACIQSRWILVSHDLNVMVTATGKETDSAV